MRLIHLLSLVMLFSQFAFGGVVETADRTSYIITLDPGLNAAELNQCLDQICKLSGDEDVMECEIVSERFKIAAARLSNAACADLLTLSCVKSFRPEKFDFEPRPRIGRSN